MSAPAPDIHRDLQDLRSRTLRLGGRVEDMVVRATRAMVQRDGRLAEETMTLEPEVDRMAAAIDTDCVRLMDRWRPGGAELRALTFTLKTLPHLARIGALASAVCDKARSLAGDGVTDPAVDLSDMGALVSEMLGNAIDAFVNQDAAAAAAVVERDDALDEQYDRVKLARMRDAQSAEDTAELLRAIHTLMVAKHLERMGDHATEIAEKVLDLYDARPDAPTGRYASG
jgi:phosphate transport system protein